MDENFYVCDRINKSKMYYNKESEDNFMPKDPVMLLSYVNMKLRDFDSSLQDFCAREGVDEAEVIQKMSSIGYAYDETKNQFV